jgi:CDP-ribitol ribitolphosphotransferase
MISRLNRKTSIDFELLRAEIEKRHPGTKIIILNHRMVNKLRHVCSILVEMYHLATAKAAILDSYVIPVSILTHRKQLVVVQIWHALGAIKQFGRYTIDKPAGNSAKIAEVMAMHRGYTYITAGSKAMTPVFSQCFGEDEAVIQPFGMPRVDYLMGKESKEKAAANIKKLFPNLGSRKVILYAPTFRKHGKISPQKLIDEIDFDKYVLIIKQHTLDKTKLKSNNGVKVVRDEINALDLLHKVDYVITDYSAITFEAALIGKPLYFWNYDYATYAGSCGFAMDYYQEMPGLVSADPKKIIADIVKDKNNTKLIKRFADKYVDVQNGTCTAKIAGLLGL